MTHSGPVPEPVIFAGYVILAAAFLLTMLRLVRGPSLPDRVAAFDLLTMLSIGLIGLHALATGRTVILDVAVVLALVAFLATVAIAQFVQRGVGRHLDVTEERP